MTTDKQHRIYPPLLADARELRQPQTPAEIRLWARLRDRQLAGYKFRRQHPIGRFITDFYCAERHLVIEIDGDSHAGQIEYDQARTQWLNAEGYRVIRFTKREVFNQLEAVLEAILKECENDGPSPPAPLPKSGEGSALLPSPWKGDPLKGAGGGMATFSSAVNSGNRWWD